MKKNIISLFIIGLFLLIGHNSYLSANPLSGSDENADKFEVDYSGFDGTQTEMNDKAYQEYKRADDKLNEIYQRILVEYKKNKLFLEKLKDAELAWIKYRDAQLEARFPGKDKSALYGSVYPMCYSLEKAAMTWERVKELNRWLESPIEGNVGAGSYGQKEPLE